MLLTINIYYIWNKSLIWKTNLTTQYMYIPLCWDRYPAKYCQCVLSPFVHILCYEMEFIFLVMFIFCIASCEEQNKDITNRCKDDNILETSFAFKTSRNENKEYAVSTHGNLKMEDYKTHIKIYLSKSVSGKLEYILLIFPYITLPPT